MITQFPKNAPVEFHRHSSKNPTSRVLPGRNVRLAPLVIASQVKWSDIIVYRTPTTQTLNNLVRFSTPFKPILLLQKHAVLDMQHPPLIVTKPLPHISGNISKQLLNHTRLPVWAHNQICRVNPRVRIHSETRTWHDNNIQSKAPCR